VTMRRLGRNRWVGEAKAPGFRVQSESVLAIGAYQRAGRKTVTITSVVADLTGHPPRTFPEFARDHAALFRG
jgi:hypothetical protein